MKKVIASYGAGEAVAKGLNVALALYLATIVDTESYGAVALFLAIELVLVEVMLLGQHTALLRFFETNRVQATRLYASSVIVVLISSALILCVLAVVPISRLAIFAVRISQEDLFLIGLGVAFQIHLALYLAYLRVSDKVLEYCVLRILFQVVKFIVVCVAVAWTKSASGYPIGVLAANITLLFVLPRIEFFTKGYSQMGSASANLIRGNLQIGVPLAIHTTAHILYAIADRFFLAELLDYSQLAVYSFAAIQGSAIFFAINVFALAYVPKIYRSQEYNQQSARALREFLFAAIVGAAAMASIVYFVVFPASLLYVPSEYEDGRGVLALILFSGVLQSFAYFGIYKLTLLRKVISVPIITLIVLICNLAMNWSLIPMFGIKGAAISALLSQMLAGTMFVATAHFVSRRKRHRVA